MKLKRVIIFLAIIIAGVVLVTIFNPYRFEISKLKEREKTYKLLDTKTSVHATILNIHDHRGTTAVYLSDSSKFFIKHSRNYNYDTPWLSEFLNHRDLLIKNSDSHTIWIERNDKHYYFIMGKCIQRNKDGL